MTHIHKQCGQWCNIRVTHDGSTYTDVKCSACGKKTTIHEYNEMDKKVEEFVKANFYVPEYAYYPSDIKYDLFNSGTEA
jgi:hypothetical protein